MCTVTLFPNPNGRGFRVVANRDEQHTRAASLPPALQPDQTTLCPIDPVGGGTWIAVNAWGVVATLLNKNTPPPPAPAPEKSLGENRAENQGPDGGAVAIDAIDAIDAKSISSGGSSRGRLVLKALSGAATAEAAVKQLLAGPDAMDPAGFGAFTLVLADMETGVFEVVGDGQAVAKRRVGNVFARHVWTSSGLGDHLVAGPRLGLFAEVFDGVSDDTAWDAQLDYHRHTGGSAAMPTEHAVCMQRSDARTVSQTVVEVTHDQAEMVCTLRDAESHWQTPAIAVLPHAVDEDQLAAKQRAQAKRRKRWVIGLGAYAVLWLASFVTQAVRFDPNTPDPGQTNLPRLAVPLMAADGPVDANTAGGADNDQANHSVSLAWRSYGPDDAPVKVLALHGSPTFGQDFDQLGPALVDAMHALAIEQTNTQAAENNTSLLPGVQVVAPVMPGFGESTPYVPDQGCDAQAQYALAAMDALGWDHAWVLGYSLGGGAAIRMAEQAPDRVDGLVMLSAVGDQTVEGTGDYYFEHFKYALVQALGVWGVDALPHFGLLGERHVRVAFAQSFWDTDQRPYASLLKAYPADKPMLIVHGKRDALVPVKAAQRHHAWVSHSQLVWLDGGHGMLYQAEPAKAIARHIAQCIAKHITASIDQHATGASSALEATAASQAATAPGMDSDADAAPGSDGGSVATQSVDASGAARVVNPWLTMAGIAMGTFVSEDYTCVSVGLLINHGKMDLVLGVLGCFIGIFVGDLLLFGLGRWAGPKVLQWKPVKRWAPQESIDGIGRWYEKHGLAAVFASRFMPGTRFPLYVTAGIVGRHAWRFALWAAISDIVYTPLVVVMVAVFGDTVAAPLTKYLGHGWLSLLVVALLLVLAIKWGVQLATKAGRRRWVTRWLRWRHHEWWPAWAFYAPLLPVWLFLAIKHKSLTCWTAANPAMPQGGVLGESKAEILAALPQAHVVPWTLLDAMWPAERLVQLQEAMQTQGWTFPVVLKPDVGERGAAVAKVHSLAEASVYLSAMAAELERLQPLKEADADATDGDGLLPPPAVIVQAFHPGPHECGVFYVRHPEEPCGQILAITDKRFPVLEGDGQHTAGALIQQHPRFCMQADLFMDRLGEQADTVLAKGERLPLTMAGNHAQGCLFVDGAALYTDALSQAIDAIAQTYEGFFFGRFDIRCRDIDALKNGRALGIVELNGVTSECTNVYDPSWTVWQAYQQLAKQWAWCFAIGATNAKAGAAKASKKQLLAMLWQTVHRGPRPPAA